MDLRLLRALLVAVLCLTGAGVGAQVSAEPAGRARIELRQGVPGKPGLVHEDKAPQTVHIVEHVRSAVRRAPCRARVPAAPRPSHPRAVPRFLRHHALLI